MSNIATVNNLFYEARLYNNTLQPLQASTDENLIFPLLIDGAKNYNLGVSKLSVPLSQIPLTKSNIPLKYYQVGLQSQGQNATAFVKQIGSDNNNYVYILNGLTINKYNYTASGTTFSNTFDLSQVCKFIKSFIFDDYQNIYIAGSNENLQIADTLFIYSTETSQIITTLSFTNIKSLYLDNSQNLYVLDETIGSLVCNIYNNVNNGSSVVLTLLGTITQNFQGNTMLGGAFVVADELYIAIGHDNDIITFYNNSLGYTAISDYTLPGDEHYLQCANILNQSNTLLIGDTQTSNDCIYGVESNELFNIPFYTQKTAGNILQACYIDAGYIFSVGTDNNTYSQLWSSTSSTSSWSLTNSTTQIKAIASNKFYPYAVKNTGNQLLGWDLDFNTTPSNLWFNITSNASLPDNTNPITAFDFDIHTDKLLAVCGSNLYTSNYPVYPLNYFAGNSSKYNIEGVKLSTLDIQNETLSTSTITSLSQTTAYKVDNNNIGGFYYFLEGNSGSQSIVKRNSTNYNFSNTSTYTFTETNTIYDFAVGSGHFLIIDGITKQKIFIYARDTTTLLYTIDLTSISNCEITSICHLSGAYFAYGYNINDSSTNAYITTYDANSLTGNTFEIDYLPGQSNINSMCSNLADQDNNLASLWLGLSNGGNGYLFRVYWDNNYTTKEGSTMIKQNNGYLFKSLSSNRHCGHIYYILDGSLSGNPNTIQVMTFVNNYQNPITITTTTTNITDFKVLPDLDNVLQYTQITSNEQLLSVCVSRSVSGELYAIALDQYVYKGYLSSGSITFSQVSSWATHQYNSIMTKLNDDPNTDSRLTSLSISSQTQNSQITKTNTFIKSIAKNNITLQFMVANPATSKLDVYDYQLSLQYQLLSPIPNATYIYNKNGEDIDAGKVDIYSYEPLIDAINVAFGEALSRLNAKLTTTIPTAPSITLNYGNGNCTISYDTTLSQSTGGILFNTALWRLIKFQPYKISTTPGINGMYSLPLKANSTSITQSTSSIWVFNQLSQIAIQSNTLFVADSYFGNNQTNRIISTIDIPIQSNLENNNILYYQPTFIRPYSMPSNNPINQIQIDILYRYRDFTTYNLLLEPGMSFELVLDFIKKF